MEKTYRQSSDIPAKMTDKKKTTTTNEGGNLTTTDLYKMAPDEYLDRYGVTTYLKDVVTLILENRPEDPMEFITDYFKNVVSGTSPLVRSYRYIKLTPRSRAAFFDNLVAAYHSLTTSNNCGQNSSSSGSISSRSNLSSNSSSGAAGVGACTSGSITNQVSRGSGSKTIQKNDLTGQDMKALVKLVCADFPEYIITLVVQSLCPTETCTVPFQEFAAAINVCLLYEDFILNSQKLFVQLDKQKLGLVDRNEFIQVLKQTEFKGEELRPTIFQTLRSQIIHTFSKTRIGSTERFLSFDDFMKALFQLCLSDNMEAARNE